jgi:hypothetical protein
MATRARTGSTLYRYRLHVQLEDITPTIWRTVWVEGQMSLVQLHHVLQAAMGWTDAHLHQFDIGGVTYATPHPDDDFDEPRVDERKVLLKRVLSPDLRFTYLYDFGDSWRHRIVVDQVKPMKESYGAAHVEDGACASPPEDSGGAHQYQAFLDERLEHPRSDEVVSFMQWAGEDFDPLRFDRRAANAALLRMAWNAWGVK